MTNFDYFKEILNRKRAEDLIVKTNRPYRCRFCRFRSVLGCVKPKRYVDAAPQICRLGIRDWLCEEFKR